MCKILLTLIVQNSRTGDKAEIVKKEIINKLPKSSSFIAKNKYEKFPNSFMLDIAVTYPIAISKESMVYEMLKISSVIARPWSVYFDEKNSELIFNKIGSTQFANKKFESIFWGHIQIA